jgi:hypothetical protein
MSEGLDIWHFSCYFQRAFQIRDAPALVAQSVEHIHGKDVVSGSIPLEG